MKYKEWDIIQVLCASKVYHEAIVTNVTETTIDFKKQNNENTSHNWQSFQFNKLEAERYII